MRQMMMLEDLPIFHTELLTGFLDEKVCVWQAQIPDDVTAAFDIDLEPSFAIVDSNKCGSLIKEFRRWFPGVPIVKITNFTVEEHQIRVQIKGKKMVTLTFPEKNIFDKIEKATHKSFKRQHLQKKAQS